MANEENVQDRVEALFDDVEDAPEEVEEVEEEVVDDLDEPQEEIEDTGEEPVEEEVTSDLVEIEWEGQLYEAPAVIAEALMRNNDYTQKTQEVASQRKELEIQHENLKRVDAQYKFAQEVQVDLIEANQLEKQSEEARQYLRANVDQLTSNDITKIQMAISDNDQKRDNIIREVQNRNTGFQQAQEQLHAELLTKGTEVLRQKIPGWGQQQQRQVHDYALATGFTEQEIGNVVDPRQVEALWKASQFDALQSGKSAAVKKVVSTPSIKAKSRNPMPEDVKAKLNLRKTLKSSKLSSKEKARAIEKSFGERFG